MMTNAMDTHTPTRGIGNVLKKNKRKAKEKNVKTNDPTLIKDHPLFKTVKPKKNFAFYSDYFEVDGTYGTVLTVMHHKGSDDNLGYFWGIQLIPKNLGDGVTVRRLEHVGRVSESWIAQHQGRAEGLLKNRANEMAKDGSFTSNQKLGKEQQQLVDIAHDLMQGASYLRVAIRLLVKAPSLEQLDDAVQKINRQYKDRFETVFAAPYVGEQRRELSNLTGKLENKLGKNFMFTSSEFAGNYSLVTRGIEDPRGEYIGQMEGDVNNSAVLMDLDNYESHVVIAGSAEAQTLTNWDFNRQRGADVWGAKLGMSALVRNKKVVHLVLNNARISTIGIDLSDVTSNVNMTQGDINPFELFGERDDELSIFPAHVEKMYLMLEQLQPTTPEQRARVKGELNKVLNKFYVDRKMWVQNAQQNRDAIRLVGIPHRDVPKLPVFQAYLEAEYNALVNRVNKDTKVQDAYQFLATAFRGMMDSNGDLFNTTTSEIIDRAAVSNRVIYDFGSLIKRGHGVMMAQFVNALAFSVGNLSEGDVVVLHGAEQIAPGIKQYVRDQFDQLGLNGVRTVFIYNSVERMVKDVEFNQFQAADYTLLGGMSRATVELYEETLRQEVPIALKNLLEHKERRRYYLRRGFDNVVFANDVQMGFNATAQAQR